MEGKKGGKEGGKEGGKKGIREIGRMDRRIDGRKGGRKGWMEGQREERRKGVEFTTKFKRESDLHTAFEYQNVVTCMFQVKIQALLLHN